MAQASARTCDRVLFHQYFGSAGDEIPPDCCRQFSSRHVLHGRVVVIAEPYAYDQLVAEPHEPCVPVILGGAGLPRSEAAPRRAASGSLFDGPLQQFDQEITMLAKADPRLSGCAQGDRLALPAEPHGFDPPWFDWRRSRKNGSISASQIEKAHLCCTKREARRGGQGSI